MRDAIDPVSLFERLERLNADEREVIFCVLDRIEQGRKAYGPLDLSNDARDWEAEWLSEDLDGCIYRAMRTVQMRRQRGG